MVDSILGTPSPEILLAVQEGVTKAIKGHNKTAGVKDQRDNAGSDQVIKGLCIDLTLEIEELKIGHDTDKAPTVSIPLKTALALFVAQAGATRENTLKKLLECCKQALTVDKKVEKELLNESGVAAGLQQLQDEVISKLPRTPVAKRVDVKGASLKIKGAALIEE